MLFYFFMPGLLGLFTCYEYYFMDQNEGTECFASIAENMET